MPKKSRKHTRKTRKQKVINMIGCSKKHKHNKSCKNKKDLGNNVCPKCGPNCHCGPNCNCPHPCPGTCYLNRRMVKKGGSGCGSCGCPIGGLSYTAMNKFGGSNLDKFNQPVLIDGTNNNNFVEIPGTTQKGGNCSACGINAPQSGGNFFKPAAPIPGPFAGSAWGAPVKDWPSMNGVGGDRNYLDSYGGVITNDPQQQMSMADAGYKTLNSMVGGKHKKRASRKSQRGGGIVPEDLVNLGRNFTFNLKSAYNSLNGYNQPVDPLPYKDQLTRSFNNSKLLF
jgi:hypothetical protein